MSPSVKTTWCVGSFLILVIMLPPIQFIVDKIESEQVTWVMGLITICFLQILVSYAMVTNYSQQAMGFANQAANSDLGKIDSQLNKNTSDVVFMKALLFGLTIIPIVILGVTLYFGKLTELKETIPIKIYTTYVFWWFFTRKLTSTIQEEVDVTRTNGLNRMREQTKILTKGLGSATPFHFNFSHPHTAALAFFYFFKNNFDFPPPFNIFHSLNGYSVSFMKIEETLRKHGKKATPERLELFAWMKEKHLFTSADIEGSFSHIGRASIFRTLKLFVELGVLRRVNLGESGESYEVECCRKCHHEHMKCNSCGEILSFHSEQICSKIFTEAKKLGFQISEHSLSIFGTCKKCNS